MQWDQARSNTTRFRAEGGGNRVDKLSKSRIMAEVAVGSIQQASDLSGGVSVMRSRIAGILVLSLMYGAIAANSQITTGTISGTVKDATGAVLPGVTLLVVNEETGSSRTVRSDAAGHYHAALLNVGQYKVTASLDGFQSRSEEHTSEL